jgi:RNA polymerase sigma-54 factor
MDLGMQLRQKLGLRLEQKLAPQLIQSMELLQLPMLELQARINQELQENPTLELLEETETPGSSSEDETADQEEIDKYEAMDEEWDQYFRETSRPRRSDDERDVNQAIANTAAPPDTLQEYLVEQIRMLDLPEEMMELAEEIIYNLDDSGYLRYSLNDMVESSNGKFSLPEAREILRLIQSVGPPGVGARDIAECLLLQLNGAVNSVLEKLIVTYHLDDIQNNRLPKIAKDTGRSLEEVKTAVERISHLNPKPGETISASHARYVIPDMEVKYVEGRYEVALQDSFVPGIRISPYYRKMLERGERNSKVTRYVRNKIAAANWLISSLEQRKDTLQRIGNEIVRVQHGFFEEGVSGLRPLRMQDVADAIGVHVATVSRATADKYVDTPRGVYPLKFFFSGGLDTTDGGRQARKSVEEELKQLIDAEDKHKPISDGEIVKRLNENGIEIARRTVAKYRNQLGIPSASLRKEH